MYMLMTCCSLFSPHYQSEHFSFLGVNNQSNLSDMRCRTTFYTALGRLLMVDLGKYTKWTMGFFSSLDFSLKNEYIYIYIIEVLTKNIFVAHQLVLQNFAELKPVLPGFTFYSTE